MGRRQPESIAVLTFISQTLTRTNRYQVYLAMYAGVGLSLAIFCAIDVSSSSRGVSLLLSSRGLHAAIPLLLFWMIAGLRIAFALPLNLSAGWIFRSTGVSVRKCSNAAKQWVLLSAGAIMLPVLLGLMAAGFAPKPLLVQAVFGLCLCFLLTDGFFLGQQGVPFNKARTPGRTNLPLLLTLYLGFFPLFVYSVVGFEVLLEKHLRGLLLVAGLTVGLRVLLQGTDRGPEEIEEEMEGYDEGFQVLGLS